MPESVAAFDRIRWPGTLEYADIGHRYPDIDEAEALGIDLKKRLL